MIRDCFIFLKAYRNLFGELEEIYNYFFAYYIGTEFDEDLCGIRYPIKLWHGRNRLFGDVPRTNNAIEGWHNSFRSIFGYLSPTFKNFVVKLKHEERSIF